MRIYAKLEGQNPTGSIKDRVAKAMIEAAEASGELEPGRHLLEPTSGNTGISLALVAKLKGYPLTCVMPENATEERKRLLRLYGAEIVYSPGDEGSNGAVRLALELAERDPSYFMPFQYANEANPRAHYEGTGAEIAEALDRVDVLVAGLGTGGTLMGAGERLRETFPDVVVAAAEPLPGDPVMGLRSLEDGYVPPILDVSKLDRKMLVSNEESVAAVRGAARPRGDLRRRLVAVPSSTSRASSPTSSTRASSSASSPTAAGSTSPPTSGSPDDVGAVDGAHALVVIPPEVRAALVAHADAEAPNEACGLVLLRTASPSATCPAATPPPSPYRFELEVEPRRVVPRGRGLRARRLPLAPLVAAAPLAHGRREHRPLGRASPT